MRTPIEPRVAVVLCWAGALVLAGGCASSSEQTESAGAASDASEEARSGDESEEAVGERRTDRSGEASGKPEREPVELASLVGAETSGGLPAGCPKEWQKLEGRRYEGTKYACSGFRVPGRYRQPTVIIGVKDDTVRQVTLQAFYEKGDPIEEVYAEVTDLYEKRCDAEGASGSSMAFVCSDYVAQVSHRKRTGALRIIIGLENWDMP